MARESYGWWSRKTAVPNGNVIGTSCRNRRQEESLDDSPESFALQGKNLIDLLKVAADRSNTLLNMTRMIAGIVFKDSTLQSGGSGIDDDEIKAEIRRQIQNESSSGDLDLPNSNNSN